jgi:hypothetical protein
MTFAAADQSATQTSSSRTVPIVILGTDALLAALPASPVQLAHACLRAGFANAIPASWGDEIIATAVLRRLADFGTAPAIQCTCPIVAHRLLSVSADLRSVLVTLVPPPVALARYVRTLSQPSRTRITYVGACPGALDDAIDIRMTPDALIAMLAERQIAVDEQPRVFESIIPPDRRRFRSQSGGTPTAEALWTETGARALVEIEGEDFVAEIAQQVLTGKMVLLDASTRLGCACAGAAAGLSAKEARARVAALEPPRATSPVIEEDVPIELDLLVPAAPRTPIDVVAVSPVAADPPLSAFAQGARGGVVRVGPPPSAHAITPPRGSATVGDVRPRSSGTMTQRPLVGSVPVSRGSEGRSLPRAYVARRRSSPKGIAVVAPPAEEAAAVPHAGARGAGGTNTRTPDVPTSAAPADGDPLASGRPNGPPTFAGLPLSRRQATLILGMLLAAVAAVSAVVSVIVERALRR